MKTHVVGRHPSENCFDFDHDRCNGYRLDDLESLKANDASIPNSMRDRPDVPYICETLCSCSCHTWEILLEKDPQGFTQALPQTFNIWGTIVRYESEWEESDKGLEKWMVATIEKSQEEAESEASNNNVSRSDYSRDEVIAKVKAGESLEGANLSGLDLSHDNLDGSMLNGANLSKTRLSFTTFNRAQMVGVNLRGADLLATSMNNANLTDADFTNAILNGVMFVGAVLENADMRNVTGFGTCSFGTVTGKESQNGPYRGAIVSEEIENV